MRKRNVTWFREMVPSFGVLTCVIDSKFIAILPEDFHVAPLQLCISGKQTNPLWMPRFTMSSERLLQNGKKNVVIVGAGTAGMLSGFLPCRKFPPQFALGGNAQTENMILKDGGFSYHLSYLVLPSY